MKKATLESVIAAMNIVAQMSDTDALKVIDFINGLTVGETAEPEKPAKKTEVKSSKKSDKDEYNWYQHFEIDGLKVTILYKENNYNFNKKSKMIKYRLKDLNAKWSGDYENKIWTWTLPNEKAVDALRKMANAGFPKK